MFMSGLVIFILREGKVDHCMQLWSHYGKSSNQSTKKSISRDDEPLLKAYTHAHLMWRHQ